MKRFTFRLDPVLEYQVRQEEMAVMRQAAAYSELHRQEALLEKIGGELIRIREEKIEVLSSDECLSKTFYVDYLSRIQISQQKTVDLCSQDLDRKRHELVEARKAKRIMEKLKEKLYEDFRKKTSLNEIKNADEQAMILESRRREVVDA